MQINCINVMTFMLIFIAYFDWFVHWNTTFSNHCHQLFSFCPIYIQDIKSIIFGWYKNKYYEIKHFWNICVKKNAWMIANFKNTNYNYNWHFRCFRYTVNKKNASCIENFSKLYTHKSYKSYVLYAHIYCIFYLIITLKYFI